MFQRLYAIYDRRFVDSTRALSRTTERKVWNRESPLLADTTVQDDLFAAMTPRVGGRDGVCPPLRPRNGGQRDDRTASITRDEIVARLDERHRRFVGLTNFYKWATIRRDRASGGQDRSAGGSAIVGDLIQTPSVTDDFSHPLASAATTLPPVA